MVLLGMLEQAGVEVRHLAGWHSATRPSDWTRCGWGCQGVLVGLEVLRAKDSSFHRGLTNPRHTPGYVGLKVSGAVQLLSPMTNLSHLNCPHLIHLRGGSTGSWGGSCVLLW